MKSASPPPVKRASPRPRRRASAPTKLAEELAQSFFDLLIRHRIRMQALMVQSGFSILQFHTLQTMGDKPQTMRELAKAALCEPSHLTGIIDKLEAQGLVARKASTEDRRIKQVSLTRAGVAFRKRPLDRLREPAPWMSALSAADQQQLAEILKRALVFAQPPDPSSES